MKGISNIYLWVAMALILFATGCSNLRHLEEGQQLYTGAEIRLEADQKIEEKELIESELRRVLRPEPNGRVLGWSPRLWMYQVAGEPRGKGLRHLMRNRFGRPPVLFEQVDPAQHMRLMTNRLFNLGFFDPEIDFQLKEKARKAGLVYHVWLNPPFLIDTLHRTTSDDALERVIDSLFSKTPIRPGQPYRLEDLRRERQRIDREMKALGYFYFHPDWLLFRADTSVQARSIGLHLALKPEAPRDLLKPQRIGQITVLTDYLQAHSSDTHRPDTLVTGRGLQLIDNQRQFRPALFHRAIWLQTDSLYNLELHQRSLRQLMGLGVFRFVNIRFVQAADSVLDARILLTPLPRRSLGAEIRGVSKSNNFAGPGLSVNYSNLNLLGGAELLRLGLSGSYEALVGRSREQASSWEAGLDAELLLPRLSGPFPFSKPQNQYVPRTSLGMGFNYLDRTDAFSLSSLRLHFGYQWNPRAELRHRLNPVSFSFFSLGRISPEIEGLLEQGVFQRRGLFEQFIIGSEYSLFYNSQQKENRISRHDVYANLNLDVSGNLASALFSLIPGATRDEEGAYSLFGQAFSQYARADIDLRYYRRLDSRSQLATRLIVGAGVPYGNADQLPYLKLFSIGGVNSIRAFRPRSLGPGTYALPDSLAGGFNLYQTGDLKLELNAEYRFNLGSVFRGAVFADAGNIWRWRENENTPGGEFRLDRFYEQLALGAGLGLRIDATFFVLRFDFAIPLAIPYSGRDGFFDPIQPGKREWRREYLVFNLAIGYPF